METAIWIIAISISIRTCIALVESIMHEVRDRRRARESRELLDAQNRLLEMQGNIVDNIEDGHEQSVRANQINEAIAKAHGIKVDPGLEVAEVRELQKPDAG